MWIFLEALENRACLLFPNFLINTQIKSYVGVLYVPGRRACVRVYQVLCTDGAAASAGKEP